MREPDTELKAAIEEQIVTAFKLGLMDGMSRSPTKPNPIPALKESQQNIELAIAEFMERV